MLGERNVEVGGSSVDGAKEIDERDAEVDGSNADGV